MNKYDNKIILKSIKIMVLHTGIEPVTSPFLLIFLSKFKRSGLSLSLRKFLRLLPFSLYTFHKMAWLVIGIVSTLAFPEFESFSSWIFIQERQNLPRECSTAELVQHLHSYFLYQKFPNKSNQNLKTFFWARFLLY